VISYGATAAGLAMLLRARAKRPVKVPAG
jgi:hypothetical protein